MIDLLVDDDRSGFGLATAFDLERLPYRRIARAEDFDARVLVVGVRTLSEAAAALLRRVPAVVVGVPAGPPGVLPAAAIRPAEGPAAVPLADEVWPARVRERARQFGRHALRLPRATVHVPAAPMTGTVLGTVRVGDGEATPAVVRDGRVLWSLVDLGAALADLLDEGYGPPHPPVRAPRVVARWALQAYYRFPEPIRRRFQQRVYRRVQGNLAALGAAASEYPVDAAGWLLLELLRALVGEAAGGCVRLARWPAPYGAAAALTHDLEPARYAYTRGLRRFLDRVEASGHPASFGVVARPARRWLRTASATRLREHDVVCHGLEHVGETVAGSREDIAVQIAGARREVEERVGRPVRGFRSPRLDRTPALLWALDRAGFRFDSSYPDVDRENVTGFGTGVRLALPFRPPLEDGGRVRPSACLELPVSAPDCIQPLFEGRTVWELRRAVRAKVAFVQATGGLYVGIVHAGVFGPRDAERRETHLRFVRRCVTRPDVWLASVTQIADWWCARERLEVRVVGDHATVTNRGDHAVEGARLVVERGERERSIALPALAPGAAVAVPVGELDAGRGPWSRHGVA
jgi:peptidoglycan/xylan/chitin deacetylase (PgdA/CDA1 family)